MSILSYINSLVRSIGKEDVFEDIRITRKEISGKLIPLFKDADTFFKTHKLINEKNINLNNQFMTVVGKRDKYKNMFDYINDKLPTVLINLDYISSELDKSLESQLVSRSMTYRRAMLIKSLDLISFASNYSFKLLKFVYYFEDKNLESSDYNDLSMPPVLIKAILSNITIYARIIKTFSVKPDEFVNQVSGLKDIVIDEKTAAVLDAAKDSSDSLNLDSLNPVGFDGNPIFHFRLMIAEWQANRYKLNQETKQYLELKLLNLKLQDEGKNDPKIQREIEYVANRINSLEYKIAKAEKSVGGLD